MPKLFLTSARGWEVRDRGKVEYGREEERQKERGLVVTDGTCAGRPDLDPVTSGVTPALERTGDFEKPLGLPAEAELSCFLS